MRFTTSNMNQTYNTLILSAISSTWDLISSSNWSRCVSILSSSSILHSRALSMLMRPRRISVKSRFNCVMGILLIGSISVTSSSLWRNGSWSYSSTRFKTYISRVVRLSDDFTSLALSMISSLKPNAPPRLDWPIYIWYHSYTIHVVPDRQDLLKQHLDSFGWPQRTKNAQLVQLLPQIQVHLLLLVDEPQCLDTVIETIHLPHLIHKLFRTS